MRFPLRTSFVFSLRDARAKGCRGSVESFQDQRPVRAPEAEGVGKGILKVHLPGMMRDEVEVAALPRFVQVQRRREGLVFHGQRQDSGLQAARRSEEMA